MGPKSINKDILLHPTHPKILTKIHLISPFTFGWFNPPTFNFCSTMPFCTFTSRKTALEFAATKTCRDDWTKVDPNKLGWKKWTMNEEIITHRIHGTMVPTCFWWIFMVKCRERYQSHGIYGDT